MKLSAILTLAGLAAIPAAALALAPGGPMPKAGPPEVPYLCDDGRKAKVIYENGVGSRHARALVEIDGRTIELEQAPTLYGVRYRAAAADEGTPLAWSIRGEEAWLTEAPEADSYTREERALARCVRLRGALAEDHGDTH